ncbi:MAG: TylF/MycF family methyltransferase [Pseudomonadota bacterium]|nr:TylF/MycF family methyltransferase [Pseudomonadota bacterium]
MKPLALVHTKHLPLVQVAKSVTPPILWQMLYRAFVIRDIADGDRYGTVYQPWLEPHFKALHLRIDARTLVSPEGCWQLESRLRQSLACEGQIYELGVYKGGTARLLREGLEGAGRTLRLFDTFQGMREVDATQGDRCRVGDFADTSLEDVRAYVGNDPWIDYRPGWVPDTFKGIEGDKIAFAHIDLDLHDPILASCGFIYPRLASGGAMIFDDYGGPSTAGARRAIDTFFRDKPEVPLILQTGQAIVTKL